MVVGVGFCKIKVDSNSLLVLKIKCTKFHQDRSKTVDLHIKYTNRHSVFYIHRYFLSFPNVSGHKIQAKRKFYYLQMHLHTFLNTNHSPCQIYHQTNFFQVANANQQFSNIYSC
jgi:hypothetical protein